MQFCDVCDFPVQSSGSTRHYECSKGVEDGEPISEIRMRVRKKWLERSDEDIYDAASANITAAGWQCAFLTITGGAVGALFGHDVVSLVTATVGATAGLVSGLSLFWHRKLQSLTARRIHLLWRERQNLE